MVLILGCDRILNGWRDSLHWESSPLKVNNSRPATHLVQPVDCSLGLNHTLLGCQGFPVPAWTTLWGVDQARHAPSTRGLTPARDPAPYVAGFMTICFERPVVHAACLDKVNSPERVSKLTGLPGPKTKLAIRPAILTHP
jgi:hypothetical protein